MKILKGSFIEFGDFLIARDSYPIAIVSGDYEIVEMAEEDLNEATFDWIDLDHYEGQIVFRKHEIELLSV